MIPRASFTLAACLAAWLAPAATAQDAVKKGAGPAGPEFRELVVSPSPAPVPALRYALMPSSARLEPGDGAPILLRLRHGRPDDRDLAEIDEKVAAWGGSPPGSALPAEAAALVDHWRAPLDLLAIGVRRETCDWGYPFREQAVDIIDLAMPDLDSMRTWGRFVAVKARVEMDRRDFDAAARSLATGFALGARVAEGPFLINGLFGMGVERVQLEAVESWIATPGSPNLYWALTDLGRPLVSLDRAVEQERLLIERSIPELAEGPEPTTAEGWSARLAAIDRRMRGLAARLSPDERAELAASLGADLSEYKRRHLEEFRRRLVEAGGLAAARVRAMSDDEAATRGLMLAYRIVWDEIFRDRRLSFKEAEAREEGRKAEEAAAKHGPAALFALFAPAIPSVRISTAQLDRQVAMLRAVEAVRMYAAANGGRLPAALTDVREAPVPVDPATEEPFGWKADGGVGTLSAPEPLWWTPGYRITVREP